MHEFHYVAFLDILGYSSMVRADTEGPKGEETYFRKLLEIHKETSGMKYDNLDFTITQFSDSIIIAAPYDVKAFGAFSKLVADLQLKLLSAQILIRGGITYGKHFHKEGFLFSAALIDAYRLESTLARFPRVLVSNDVFELVKDHPSNVEYIASDNNHKIVDYLHNANLSVSAVDDLAKFIKKLESNSTENVSEKGLWLREYACARIADFPIEYVRFGR